ncbi:MAG: transcriptional regulator [Chitinophagaceae bacterium]|nr:MAG: transcriptional regulator [Chitinophagaceae bacterium]
MAMMKENPEPIPGKLECVSSMKNVTEALYVLGGKWKLPLILTLLHAPKRFNEIQAEVTGISSKVLARELKDLELNEFVRRTVYPTSPPTILYEATEHSRTLKNVLHELDLWGGRHRAVIRRSMSRGA